MYFGVCIPQMNFILIVPTGIACDVASFVQNQCDTRFTSRNISSRITQENENMKKLLSIKFKNAQAHSFTSTRHYSQHWHKINQVSSIKYQVGTSSKSVYIYTHIPKYTYIRYTQQIPTGIYVKHCDIKYWCNQNVRIPHDFQSAFGIRGCFTWIWPGTVHVKVLV